VDTVQPLSALRAGQIITFHIPTGDHRVVSHRVIALTRTAGGGVDVRTKGDANTGPRPVDRPPERGAGLASPDRHPPSRAPDRPAARTQPSAAATRPGWPPSPPTPCSASGAAPPRRTPTRHTPTRPDMSRPDMSRHTTPSHRCWSRRAAWLVLPAAATAILTAAPALARTSRTAAASAGYTSATLAPPTALTFTKTCSGSSTVTLRWTATSSAYATGYLLTYTQNGSPAAPQTIAGRATVNRHLPDRQRGHLQRHPGRHLPQLDQPGQPQHRQLPLLRHHRRGPPD